MSRLWCSWKLPAHACKILLACCCLIEVKRVKKAATNPFGSEGFSCIPREEAVGCLSTCCWRSLHPDYEGPPWQKGTYTGNGSAQCKFSRSWKNCSQTSASARTSKGPRLDTFSSAAPIIGMLFCLHWISAMLSSWFRGIDSQPLCWHCNLACLNRSEKLARWNLWPTDSVLRLHHLILDSPLPCNDGCSCPLVLQGGRHQPDMSWQSALSTSAMRAMQLFGKLICPAFQSNPLIISTEIVVSVLDFTLDKDCDVCLAHRPLAYRHAMQVGTIKQAFVGWSHPNASHTNPWDERLGWMKAIQDAELIWWPLIRWKSSKTAGFSSFNHSRHRRFR